MAKRLLLTSGILLVGAVAWVVWFACDYPTGPTLRMPDGSTLILLGVTYGKHHSYVWGRRWQQWLYPVLPGSLRDRLHCTVVEHSSETPRALVAWTLRRGRSPDAVDPYVSVATPDGQEVSLGTDSPHDTLEDRTMLNRAEMLQAWELPTFPRREPWLEVRFNSSSVGVVPRVFKAFQVRNPVPGPYPVWPPEPPPSSRRTGTLTFTFLGFQRHAVHTFQRPGHVHSAPGTRAMFAVTRQGRPDAEWEVKNLRLWDATGNEWVPYGDREQMPGGPAFWFETSWPDPAACRMRVEFVPRGGSPLLPRYRVSRRIAGARPAHADHQPLLSIGGPSAGAVIRPGFVGLRAHQTPRNPGCTGFLVHYQPPREDWEVTVSQATDAGGLPLATIAHDFLEPIGVTPTGRPRYGHRSAELFVFTPRPTPAINLTFAARKSYFAEWTVKPPLGTGGGG